MNVSRKTQYALRAVVDLAIHQNGDPIKARQIADRQAIPTRFLELILSELKRAGYVRSERGRGGGYVLARPAEDLTIGEVMAVMGADPAPVACVSKEGASDCVLRDRCAFFDLWKEARDALEGVYNRTTIGDLVRRAEEAGKSVEQECPI